MSARVSPLIIIGFLAGCAPEPILAPEPHQVDKGEVKLAEGARKTASPKKLDGSGVAKQLPKYCPYTMTAEAGAKLISIFFPNTVTVTLAQAAEITKKYCDDLAKQMKPLSSAGSGVTVVYKDADGNPVSITAMPIQKEPPRSIPLPLE